ncbi:4-oxalocrotonate tautomerase family protein [Actinomadura yumaensis]|uniref:tautomerase family protein n=1 Tax=Actinomadura yumaensis TaxID=111807 RepID=UPI003617595F
MSEVMVAEGAPDTEAARAISWLVVNEIDAWFVGGRQLPAGEKPRYVVRVGVPAGSMNDDKRRDIVRRVTRVLADADEDPERFAHAAAAWVHINEIPEGNWGARGEIVRIEDIAAFVTSG